MHVDSLHEGYPVWTRQTGPDDVEAGNRGERQCNNDCPPRRDLRPPGSRNETFHMSPRDRNKSGSASGAARSHDRSRALRRAVVIIPAAILNARYPAAGNFAAVVRQLHSGRAHLGRGLGKLRRPVQTVCNDHRRPEMAILSASTWRA